MPIIRTKISKIYDDNINTPDVLKTLKILPTPSQSKKMHKTSEIPETIINIRISRSSGAASTHKTNMEAAPITPDAAEKHAVTVSKPELIVDPITGIAAPETIFPVLKISVSAPCAAKPFNDIIPRIMPDMPHWHQTISFRKKSLTASNLSEPPIPEITPTDIRIFMNGRKNSVLISENSSMQKSAAAPYTPDIVRFPHNATTAAKMGTKAFTKTDIVSIPRSKPPSPKKPAFKTASETTAAAVILTGTSKSSFTSLIITANKITAMKKASSFKYSSDSVRKNCITLSITSDGDGNPPDKSFSMLKISPISKSRKRSPNSLKYASAAFKIIPLFKSQLSQI